MCWEAWFYSILISLYPFFSWTLLLDMIPEHWEVCVLIQHLPLEFATYSPTLRLSWAGLWVPVRSEELEKAIGESKDANGSSQLSRTKEEREKKFISKKYFIKRGLKELTTTTYELPALNKAGTHCFHVVFHLLLTKTLKRLRLNLSQLGKLKFRHVS